MTSNHIISMILGSSVCHYCSLLREKDSTGTNAANKSKACLKFFSTAGCPYGDDCHFLHYLPGGLASLGLPQTAKMPAGGGMGLRKETLTRAGVTMPTMLPMRSQEQGSIPFGFKSRLCSNFEAPGGCRFGSKCNFAHGAQELRLPRASADANLKSIDRFQSSLGGLLEDKIPHRRQREPTPPGLMGASAFGAMSTAKVCIDASLAGIIIGKGGVNAKAISRASGAKLVIRDHESDSNLKNVEMEGSLDQIKLASSMVQELLANKEVLPAKASLAPQNYKSKLCENFSKGNCKYGDRCHFAHGQSELQTAPS
ncbi:hypothetical protein KP509_29G062500 [Ceratopteris richardii]|uniref:C3H1-type domain-containing protein n=1 Tax=Ceratopteris richardii TaxID=49495 RepID=A0A8T2R7F8_CERRI|nr:hypothetical protein KP509_29G062500 [Ceratopteris richardii]